MITQNTHEAALNEPGCVLDGLHGQAANNAQLVRMAIASGWDGSPGRGEDEADDALQFLNAHVIAPGLHLDWVEGDLMLTATEDDGEG